MSAIVGDTHPCPNNLWFFGEMLDLESKFAAQFQHAVIVLEYIAE